MKKIWVGIVLLVIFIYQLQNVEVMAFTGEAGFAGKSTLIECVYPANNAVLTTNPTYFEWKSNKKGIYFEFFLWKLRFNRGRFQKILLMHRYPRHSILRISSRNLTFEAGEYIWQVWQKIGLKNPPVASRKFKFRIARSTRLTPQVLGLPEKYIISLENICKRSKLAPYRPQVSGDKAIFFALKIPGAMALTTGQNSQLIKGQATKNSTIKITFYPAVDNPALTFEALPELSEPVYVYKGSILSNEVQNSALLFKIPVKLGKDFKAPFEVIDSGLHIVKNTPNFSNYSGKNLLDKEGTCLGMSITVKRFYQDGAKKYTHGKYKNLREFSIAEKDKVKRIMSRNHFRNIDLWELLNDLFERNKSTYKAIKKSLKKKRPAFIVLRNKILDYILRKVKFTGHAILGYKMIDTKDYALVLCYDPNIHYKTPFRSSTICVYDKRKKKWKVKSIFNYKFDTVKFRDLDGPVDRLFNFFAVALEGDWPFVASPFGPIAGPLLMPFANLPKFKMPKLRLPKIKW